MLMSVLDAWFPCHFTYTVLLKTDHWSLFLLCFFLFLFVSSHGRQTNIENLSVNLAMMQWGQLLCHIMTLEGLRWSLEMHYFCYKVLWNCARCSTQQGNHSQIISWVHQNLEKWITANETGGSKAEGTGNAESAPDDQNSGTPLSFQILCSRKEEERTYSIFVRQQW